MKLLLLLLFVSTISYAQQPAPVLVEITTPQGIILLKLYNQTPKHRNTFIRNIKRGLYTDKEFNRVIPSFVIQGGDLDDLIEGQEKANGKIGERIDAEFHDSLFHKKGALGAGRNDNPQKKSFTTQFYIVQGKPYTDAELDQIEIKRLKGEKIPAWKREIYKTKGGTPFLDNNYTIFGEVIAGMQVVDSIAAVPVNKSDYPLTPVKIKLRVLTKKEALKKQKELAIN